MKAKAIAVVLGALCLAGLWVATGRNRPMVEPRISGPVRAKDLVAPIARVRLAVCHLRPARVSGAQTARAAAVGKFAISENEEAVDRAPVLRATELPRSAFPPAKDFVAHGLTEEEKAAMAGFERLTLLDFSFGAADLSAQRNAALVAVETARATGGVLWDGDTLEALTADRFEALRLADWEEGFPPVTTHIAIYALQGTDGDNRTVTMGLEKFGLPELVIERPSRSSVKALERLLKLAFQLLVERGIATDGVLVLDLDAVKHPGLRAFIAEAALPGAQRKVELGLVWRRPEYGATRMAELTFPGGGAPTAAQHEALTRLFGSPDRVEQIRHDATVNAASEAAKQTLRSRIKGIFSRGLAVGEVVLVKAPFATSSGTREWMWLEVSSWKGPTITGVLDNEPGDVPELKAGAVVTVKEDEVFDFLHLLPDGGKEGNETGALMRQQLAH